jgi:hypothetical protein
MGKIVVADDSEIRKIVKEESVTQVNNENEQPHK